MPRRPKMLSLWEDVFSPAWDSYDNNITEVLFHSKPIGHHGTSNEAVGKLEIFLDIFPYDEQGIKHATNYRKFSAHGAYVFVFPSRELVVGQMLKGLYMYPEIVRFDIITTGSLLRFECDSYSIDELGQDD